MDCFEFLKQQFPLDADLHKALQARVTKGLETYGKSLNMGDVPYKYLEEELLDAMMYLVNHYDLESSRYSTSNRFILDTLMSLYHIWEQTKARFECY